MIDRYHYILLSLEHSYIICIHGSQSRVIMFSVRVFVRTIIVVRQYCSMPGSSLHQHNVGFNLNADHDIFYPIMMVAKMTKTNNELKLEQTQLDGRTDGHAEREREWCINEIIGVRFVHCVKPVISPLLNGKQEFKMHDRS